MDYNDDADLLTDFFFTDADLKVFPNNYSSVLFDEEIIHDILKIIDLVFKTYEGSNYKFRRFLITSPANCLWRWQWRAERKAALDWSMAS